MITRWQKNTFVSAIVIVGGIISWTLQHRAASTLRETHRTFQRQAKELSKLREQHTRLSNLVSHPSNSAPLSGDQFRELLRSRNEVGHRRMKRSSISITKEKARPANFL